jgi:AcrR family transcriptional regulator
MAAINYHFSDKFALYAAVIRHALSLAPGVTSMKRTVGSPEERLRTLIADVIEDMYDPAQPSWLAALLAHEFAQPTAALTTVMDELIQPRVDYVNQIIRDILGPGVSEEQVGRAGMSVTAQCFFYLYNGQVIRRLHPELLRADQKQDIVDHIYEFSLGGLRAMRRQGKPVRRRV